MKKSLIISLFYFAVNPPLWAQETNTVQTERVVSAPSLHRVEFGLRFMPTFSSFDIQTSDGNKIEGQITFGFGIGAIIAFNFSSHIGIQAEAIYNSLSQKYRDQNLDRRIKVNYMSVPLFVSFNTGKSKPVNLNFVVGPQFGMNVGSSASGPAADTVVTVFAVKRNDVGIAYGAGLEFALNAPRTIRLDIGYRGVYGLSNISDTDGTRLRVRTDSAYLGVSFLF